MNSWTNGYYHDISGKILGSVVLFDDRYKASLDKMFIGFYITEDHAKRAIEEAYKDSMGVNTPRMP